MSKRLSWFISLLFSTHTHWDREAPGNDKYVAERNLGQLCWNRCYWEFPDPWNSFAGVITRRSRLQKHRHTHTHTHYRNAYSYIKSSVFFFVSSPPLHSTKTKKSKGREVRSGHPADDPAGICQEQHEGQQTQTAEQFAPCGCPSPHVAAPSHRPWVFVFVFHLLLLSIQK